MTFQIVVTHSPSSRFGSDEPEALPSSNGEPRLFKGFRTRTGRRSASLYGNTPEVVIYDPYRHAAPGSWASREAAERNVARLTERGYRAYVEEVS